MNKFSKKRTKEFIEKLGEECPHCNGTDLIAKELVSLDIPGELSQLVECENCGREYIEIYTLTGVLNAKN